MLNQRVWARAIGVLGRAAVDRVFFDEEADEVVVHARPFRREMPRCGICGKVAWRYDNGGGRRRWRALDCGSAKVFVEGDAPRVSCLEHGVTVVSVPWARQGAWHTYEFEREVVWLVRNTPKSAVAELMRIDWATVGAIVERVVADQDAVRGDRLANVRRIGIDEVSYRRGHKYLVVVVSHLTGELLWVGKDRLEATLLRFFDLLGEERCRKVALVSADGADWIARPVAARCPNARLCLDPFHIVKWMNEALDEVRRQEWNEARKSGAKGHAGDLKGSRYALVKNPGDLTGKQKGKLAWIQKANNRLYRAYLMKEQLRQIFAPGGEERAELLDAWLTWATRCRIEPIVKVAEKIQRHRQEIANTLVYRISNGPVEGMNSRIRILMNRARGFRNVASMMALIRLNLCGYDTPLPGRNRSVPAAA